MSFAGDKPLNAGYQRNSTIHWMLIQSIHSLLENIAESSKGLCIVPSKQLLQGGGEHGKTSELHEHGPIIILLLL